METYTCEVCLKVFNERLHLRNHFLTHRNKTMNKEKIPTGISRQSILTKVKSKKSNKMDPKLSRESTISNYMYSYKKTLQLAHKISNADLKALGKKVASCNNQPLPNAVAIPLHFAPARMKYTIPKKRPIQENTPTSMNLHKGSDGTTVIAEIETISSKQRKPEVTSSSISSNTSEKSASTFKSTCSVVKHIRASNPKKKYYEKFGHPKNKVRSHEKFSKYPNSEECTEFFSALENGIDVNLVSEKKSIHEINSSSQKYIVSSTSTSNMTNNKDISDKLGESNNRQNGIIKYGNSVAEELPNGKPVIVKTNVILESGRLTDLPENHHPKGTYCDRTKGVSFSLNDTSKQISSSDSSRQVTINETLKEVSVYESKLSSVSEEPKLSSVSEEPKLSSVSEEPKLSSVSEEPKQISVKSNNIFVNKSIKMSQNSSKIDIVIVKNNMSQSYCNNNYDISNTKSTVTELPSTTEFHQCASKPKLLISDKNSLNNLEDVSHSVLAKCSNEKIPSTNVEIAKEINVTYTSDKTQECEICKMHFKNNSVLNYHKRLHSQNCLTRSLSNVTTLQQIPKISASSSKADLQKSSVKFEKNFPNPLFCKLLHCENNGKSGLENFSKFEQNPNISVPKCNDIQISPVSKGKTLNNSLVQNYFKPPTVSATEKSINQIENSTNNVNKQLTATTTTAIKKIDPLLNSTEIIEEEKRKDFKSFRCCLCAKIFKKKGYLSNHMTIVHYPNRRPTKKTFTCNICFKTFSSIMSLNDHQNSVHEKESETGKFKCALCPRSFNRNCSLVSHLNVHQLLNNSCEKLEHKDNQVETLETEQCDCKDCQLTFDSPAELSKHKKFHQVENYHGPKINIFKCTRCDRYFSMKDQYLIHKQNPCHLESLSNITDPAYLASVLLRRRKLKIKRERPNKCIQCGKRFRMTEQLSRHFRMHTGELNKYYKCRHCGKFFDKLLELKRHKLHHRNSSVNKPKSKAFLTNRSNIKQEVPSNSLEENIFHVDTNGNSEAFHNQDCFKFNVKKENLSDDEAKYSSSYPDFKSYNTYLESVMPKFSVKTENDDSDEEVFKYWIIPFTNFDMIKFMRKTKPISYYGGNHKLPQLSEVYLNVLKMSSKSNGSIECKVPASTLSEIFPKEVVINVEDIKYII